MRNSLFAAGVFGLAAFGAAACYAVMPIVLLPSAILLGLLLLLALLLLVTGRGAWLPKRWRSQRFAHHVTGWVLVLPLAAAILALGGCDTLKGAFSTPEKSVFTIRAGYDATVLVPAVAYESLPRCAEGVAQPCSDTGVVEAIRAGDLAAKAALDSAETLVRNFPDSASDDAIQAAESAVEAVRKILLDHGILKPQT